MPKVLVVAMVLGLSLGLGLVARSGLGAWLDWVNEPLRQPPDLHLVRPPVTGAPAARQAQPTTLPPTLAAATPARPTSTSAPAVVASTPQRTATPASIVGTPRPAPTAPRATAVPLGGQERRVANTDGQGVALRDTPGGARLPARGYDEGEVVTVLEQQGTWTHIRGHDGREGWVLSVTLGP
jgi:Bacterial SH3 domain